MKKTAPNKLGHHVTHHRVVSSNIDSIGHHGPSSTLHVKFRNGSHYAYHGVDRNTFELMLAAPSKGKYHHEVIKKGKFKYTKIK
jgi:KTSC domain